MNLSDLSQKRILVVGLGVTGLSVVRYLSRHGIAFEVADENTGAAALSGMDIHQQFTAELFCRFDVIVISPGVPRAHDAIVAALKSGVDVIGDIELFADTVTIPVVAVTGSNGKSTVVAWLANALNACGIAAVACGNIGDPALDALESDADVLVLELSSYQLESTYSLRPLSATVLNISEDHIDRYDDIEHYASVKRGVYKHASHCIANFDDKRTWPADAPNSHCSFFTLAESSNDSCYWQKSLLDELILSVPGEHNVANALAVLALAAPLTTLMTIDEADLIASLPCFSGLAHRSEYVGEKGGVRWYNDSKGTNVDACQKAIVAMPGPVILIAGGMSKGADFSSLATTVKQYVKLLVLIGQDRQLIADQLRGHVAMEMADTLQKAVSLASSRASSGDVVLLSPACSSFDMFKNFEDRGEQFVVAVKKVLAA
ncbi:MAG: UDP-N-acetylmuramoyl-L-alanine--D-glutamate ligase [Granulosicoccus sp.]